MHLEEHALNLTEANLLTAVVGWGKIKMYVAKYILMSTHTQFFN